MKQARGSTFRFILVCSGAVLAAMRLIDQDEDLSRKIPL
jgi:hypothetical protein